MAWAQNLGGEAELYQGRVLSLLGGQNQLARSPQGETEECSHFVETTETELCLWYRNIHGPGHFCGEEKNHPVW
jgi:hypothetical protein